MHHGEDTATANNLREMLQPLPVTKRGLAPRWVLTAVKQAVEEGRIPKPRIALTSGASALSEATHHLGRSWDDHFGKFTWNGIEFLVSEPYAAEINLQMLRELEAFTSAVGTDYCFSANSEHFPSRTVRIVIGPTHNATHAYRLHEYESGMSTFRRGA